jgi:hypothetical protein
MITKKLTKYFLKFQLIFSRDSAGHGNSDLHSLGGAMGATLGSANHLLRHPKRISNAGLKKCQYSGTSLH